MALAEPDCGAPLRVRPLSPFAAECEGIDLNRPLDDAGQAAVRGAFLAHQLLAFPGQAVEKASQIRFARYFGEIEMPVNRDYLGRDYPELHVVSNLDAEGRPTAAKALANPGNYFWHSDASYMRRPASATILHAVRIPESGGDTSFANLHLAYEALPEGMRRRIERLRAVHSWAQSRLNSGSRPATEEEQRLAPPVAHPLVRTHPETGRKGLYLGNHTAHIEGMPEAEGRALLKDLLEHTVQPRFVYRHRWRPGDLVMWDNRSLLHRASDDYDMEREIRLLHRTVVQGTVPA
ncbi:MAG: TauD/TfdA dioxygenase family protein [Alphaproteobacteria bacterium]